MRIGGKFAERLDPGAGLLMHNTCAGCHRWTRFIIALRRYCRTLRSAKVDSVRTFCYPRPASGCYANPTNPIKRTLPDKVVLHQVSLRDDEAIVGFSANDPATHTSLVSCRGRERKRAAGRRLKPLSPSTSRPPLPLQSEEKKSFPVSNEVSTSFQRFPFSRADSPADPGGASAYRERQRVCEEDQHGH